MAGLRRLAQAIVIGALEEAIASRDISFFDSPAVDTLTQYAFGRRTAMMFRELAQSKFGMDKKALTRWLAEIRSVYEAEETE